jgi:hypothetical protein
VPNEHYLIRKAIFDYIAGSSNTLRTAITATVAAVAHYKLYFGIAPEVIPGTTTKIEPPYITYNILTIPQTRDSASKWYPTVMQFNCVALSLENAEALAALLTARMDDCERLLTIGSGASAIEVTRQFQLAPDEVGTYANIIIQYSFTLQR